MLDVNGDGRNDLVTSLAHDYGVFWMEQAADGKWTKHVIDDSWSQPHALTMVDLNGDGRMDFVTGKRFMAHNGRDPGEREPLGIYWYEYIPNGQAVEWVKHVVDYSTRSRRRDADSGGRRGRRRRSGHCRRRERAGCSCSRT